MKSQDKVTNDYKLIDLKSEGYLCKPSRKLLELITILEKSTLSVVSHNNVNSNTLFEITSVIEKLSPLPLIGCKEHEQLFTQRIISFFLTTWMFFVTKQLNKNENIEKEITKEKRKLSKLSTPVETEQKNKKNSEPATNKKPRKKN